MKKTYCDICGKPASRAMEYFRISVFDKVECDKNAEVEMSLHTCFKNHSGGFGGPPDLCGDCMLEGLETLKEKLTERIGFMEPE